MGRGVGVGEPLTLPLARWQALRAASTRFRSAGNIWKKLKEQRKACGQGEESAERGRALGSRAEVWGGNRAGSLLHRNLPFRVELHLELHQAGGAESKASGPEAGALSPAL